MRLFIAIDLPEEIKDYFVKLRAPLMGLACTRAVARENTHITLKFLGDCNPKPVMEALRQIEFKPFRMRLGKLGVFPDKRMLRVVWVGAEPEQELMRLKDKIDKALPNFKDDFDKFQSHITLARINYATPEDKEKIIAFLKAEVEPLEFVVEKFTLYKSTLGPQGPVYQALGYR